MIKMLMILNLCAQSLIKLRGVCRLAIAERERAHTRGPPRYGSGEHLPREATLRPAAALPHPRPLKVSVLEKILVELQH